MSDHLITVRRGDTPAALRERIIGNDTFRERWTWLVVMRLMSHSIRCRTDAMQTLLVREAADVYWTTADVASAKALELLADLDAMDCETEAEQIASTLVVRVFREAVDHCVRSIRRAIAATN